MATHKLKLREKRRKRIRKTVSGVADKPRLTVYRSLKHVYAQIIDDDKGRTLVSANSLKSKPGSGNIAVAKEVGMALAEKAKSLKIKKVVFDRNGFIFHGVVKNLADAAREGGIEF